MLNQFFSIKSPTQNVTLVAILTVYGSL